MATNEILTFAATGTNILTQAEYVADSQRSIGNQPGTARSKLVNKSLRQTSLMSAALAQVVADNQLIDVVDTLTPTALAAMIEEAVMGIIEGMFGGANQSTGVDGFQRLPGGLLIQRGVVTNSPTPNTPIAVTFPVAFTTSNVAVSNTPQTTVSGATGWTDAVTALGFNSRCSVASAPTRWIAVGF